MSGLRGLRAKPGGHRLSVLALQIVVLGLLPAFAAVGFDLVRDDGLPLIGDTDYSDEILVPCPINLIEAPSVELASLPATIRDVIVDSRPNGDFLAGHVPGALSIPHRFVQTSASADDMDRLIEQDLAPLRPFLARPILVYGNARIGCGRALASLLLERGFQEVRFLDGGWDAWVESGRPIERADSGATAVSVDGLPEDLSGLVVVDARFARSFRRGHLPGALNVAYLMVEGPDDSRLDVLRDTADQPTLVYGSASRGEGQNLARLLATNGWRQVTYLEGGFEAWQDAGRPVE